MAFGQYDRGTLARVENLAREIADSVSVRDQLTRIETLLTEIKAGIVTATPEEIAAVAESLKAQTDDLAASRDQADKV